MGIRVSKSIGYFLKSKDMKRFLVKEAMDSEFWHNIEISEFVKSLNQLIDSLAEDDPEKMSCKIAMGAYDQKEMVFTLSDFFKNIFYVDKFKGIMFLTQNLNSYSRHDDLMDFYEETFGFKQYKLNNAIYPMSGFRFNGKTNDPLFDGLKVGKVYFGNELNSLMYIHYKKIFEGKTFYKKLAEFKCFKPKIDELIYYSALTANCLKSSVTREDFEDALEPSIITTWG